MSKQRPKNKSSFAKWTGNALMIAGAAILLLLASGLHSNKSQKSDRLDAFSSMKADVALAEQTEDSVEKQGAMPDVQTNPKLQGVEGVLTIPQIDLKAPVMLGADERTLAEGLGAIENMDAPGVRDGSYAIAGHQSYAFGQYFNRLHEIEKGQEFTFETLDGLQHYKVFDVQIVKPEQVEVLDPKHGIALLSLITCYPERSNEFRLVVQAERIQ